MQFSEDLGIQGLSKDLEQCRICSSKYLQTYLDLGITPLANKLVKPEELNKEEQIFPLNVKLCKNCFNSQLGNVVNPKILFTEYPYRSSISQPFIEHCKSMAKTVNEKYQLNKDDLVIDIASNDGCLLEAFKPYNVRVLGIDPAKNLAEIANKKDVETLPEFFTKEVAEKVVNKYGKAKLITATNVFAHVDDLNNFLSGVKTLLSPNGVFIIEVPHKKHLIEENQFDTIYHEHLSYFLAKPVKKVLSNNGLKLIDLEKINIHGGSLRFYSAKKESKLKINKPNINAVIDEEKEKGLYKLKTYKNFQKRVLNLKENLKNTLTELKKQNKKIAAFGASAKGNTLLNFCNIDNKIIDYIVDDTPEKQNNFYPGTKIPILPFTKLESDKPDYLIILAWNFAEKIIEKTKDFKEQGGKYIIPIPEVKII